MVGIIARLFSRGVRDMAAHPLAQLFTLLAVTLAVFLVGLVLLALVNFDQALGTARGNAVYQVYWHTGTDMDTVRAQWKDFSHLPWLADMRTYTPEEALKTLEKSLAFTGKRLVDIDASWQKASPLPPTAILTFTPGPQDVKYWRKETLQYLSTLPGVQRVGSTPMRDDLARAWRVFRSNVMWPVIGFLGLVLSLVVGNTIKLSLVSRETEIEIMRLVGARCWYIRLPLLVTGGLQGLLGGGLSCILLWITWLQVKQVFIVPPFNMSLLFLPLEYLALLAIIPAVMGVLSSWVAIKR